MIKVFITHNKIEAPERTENVNKLLSMFEGAEIFESIYPNTIQEEDLELLEFIKNKMKRIRYIGLVYNYLTCVKLYEKCIQEKYERVLIFEDDAQLITSHYTWEYVNQVIEKMVDMPIIYLGGSSDNRPPSFRIFITDAVLFNSHDIIKDYYNHIFEVEKLDHANDVLLDSFCRERKNRLHIKMFRSPPADKHSTIVPAKS